MCRNLHLHKQHSYWDSRAVLGGAGAAWSINGWYLVILAQFVAVLGGTGALGVGSQNASIYRRARIYTGGLATLVLGQYWVVLFGTLWYWVNNGSDCSVLGGTVSAFSGSWY